MREGKVLLIANPAAQRGNGAKAAQIVHDLLMEWLGSDGVEFALTERPGHATKLASEADNSRFGTVIALGGDGIVHEVVNGIMRLRKSERPAFGVVPVGSGNDYAKTLGMSECVPDAIVQFLDAREVAFDIGQCNGEFFAETLSFGFDAAIALDTVERRQRTGKQGTPLYLASGIDQLLHHLELYKMKMVLDGDRVIEAPVHMVAVQIGPTYGGGFLITPKADPRNGRFDICYAEGPLGRIAAAFKFLSAKNGGHVSKKGIEFASASTVQLTFDSRPPCQIDGEPLIGDGYHISMDRAALKVLVAADSKFYD